jgi:hypothetical protein
MLKARNKSLERVLVPKLNSQTGREAVWKIRFDAVRCLPKFHACKVNLDVLSGSQMHFKVLNFLST